MSIHVNVIRTAILALRLRFTAGNVILINHFLKYIFIYKNNRYATETKKNVLAK